MKSMLVKCLNKYRKSKLSDEQLANVIWAYFMTEGGWHMNLSELGGRKELAKNMIAQADTGKMEHVLGDFSPSDPLEMTK